MSLYDIANQTLPGVFHAKYWGTEISPRLLTGLIEVARKNDNHKARLCLHPTPKEKLQVTYLAFINPYKDRVHCHPDRVEVLLPILGKARYSTFNNNCELLSSELIDGDLSLAICTPKNVWHSIEVYSETFIMLEVGLGPFNENSTQFMLNDLT